MTHEQLRDAAALRMLLVPEDTNQNDDLDRMINFAACTSWSTMGRQEDRRVRQLNIHPPKDHPGLALVATWEQMSADGQTWRAAEFNDGVRVVVFL
jgi:hypothetical protein